MASTPEPASVNDNSIMPWGKFKGQRLGDVEAGYWSWFLKQDWSSKFPDLVAYAKTAAEED